jgi:SAM-dependent methyltransferase
LKCGNRIGGYENVNILNAGSGGDGYSLPEKSMTHLDLSSKRLLGLSNSIVGNIESIPVDDCSFDIVLCVGSVMNYCDPIKVISEFSRVLKMKGYLILEFENSRTLELWGKQSFNQSATIVKTFYHGTSEKIWYFSEGYVQRITSEFGLEIIDQDCCHILSPLIYRLTKQENFSAYFAKMDPLLKKIFLFQHVSSNLIVLFQKHHSANL